MKVVTSRRETEREMRNEVCMHECSCVSVLLRNYKQYKKVVCLIVAATNSGEDDEAA